MARLMGAIRALVGVAGSAMADTIKVVVPFAAGGPTDMIARLLGQDMQARLKSDVVIENKGGAGGVIANEQVLRSPPDGKTLLFASSGSHVISAALRAGQLNSDAVKSFAPIAFVGQVPMLGIVSPAYPAKTRPDPRATAKTATLASPPPAPGAASRPGVPAGAWRPQRDWWRCIASAVRTPSTVRCVGGSRRRTSTPRPIGCRRSRPSRG